MESNHSYYARRAAAERLAAVHAADARARHAHLDLAARFEMLAAAIGEVDQKLGNVDQVPYRPTGAGLIQF